MESSSSRRRWISCASSARNTAPVPDIFVRDWPSPVTASEETAHVATRALEGDLALVGHIEPSSA